MWRGQLNALEEYHCLAPDLPGHGNSADVGPFTLERSVEGLAELIRRETASGRASVLGFSIGAVVAIGLRNRHPDVVERAYVSGPTPKFGRLAASLMNAVSRVLLAVMGGEQRTNFVARSTGLSEEQVAEYREDLERITPDLVLQINNVLSGQPDPYREGPPTEIFVAEKDLEPTKRRARELADLMGKEYYYFVPGLGHAWCLEDPALFRETVRRWMSGGELGEGLVSRPV